jgi:hypothetical protein
MTELVSSHNSTETTNFATQTEAPQQTQHSLDLSVISSKSKRAKRKKNHGLVNQDFKMRKPKKVKEVTAIAHNLEKMSNNISIITSKLDDFKQNPNQEESKTIIGHVGTIMSQLNGCISNFETLCSDIKQINDARNRTYNEWMDDLQNSENGRRFLKKLQKSFSHVVGEEKLKMKKEFHKKLDRAKSKLSKMHRVSAIRSIDKMPDNNPETITKEINEIFENTCMMIRNVEKESELFEKSLEMEVRQMKAGNSRNTSTDGKTKTDPPEVKLNLNKCRQIHSDASSSTSVKSDVR